MSAQRPPRRRFDWLAHLPAITAMLAEGATGAEIARRYGLTLTTTFSGLKRHGLRIDPDSTRAARARQCHKMNADPALSRRRSATQRRIMAQPDRAEAARLHMRRLHEQPGFTARAVAAATTLEVNKRRSVSRKAAWERTMAWCPPQFRAEYDRLVYSKGLTSKEARAALEKPISAFAQTFEGRMWKLSTGKARLVPNVKFGRGPGRQTSAYGEAMS